MKAITNRVSIRAARAGNIVLFLFALAACAVITADSSRSPRSSISNERISSAPAARDSKLDSSKPDPAATARVSEAYGKLPMRFEINEGQTSREAKFIARGAGYALFLTPDEAVLRLQKRETGAADQPAESSVVRMKLAGANRAPKISGVERLQTRSNYFIGADPGKWRTNVTNFSRVKYEAVYPGVDLVWYGNQRQIEHDFVVAPGADPNRIKMSFAGADTMTIDDKGALVLRVGGEELRLLKPVAWQEANGERNEIECRFSINERNQIGFNLGRYDVDRPLVIDPVLLYSTYLGGALGESGFAIAVDKDRNAYVTGFTASTDFPGPSQIQQTPPNISADAFVLKLNSTGSAVVYGTWLGGVTDDFGTSIAVDGDGNAYVAGQTFSSDFPVTAGSLQPTAGRIGDAFITKINAAGSALIYSTYLGGDGGDAAIGIAVDASGNAYVAGTADSFDLLSVRSATGIQSARRGNPIYKTANRAGNWSASANGLRSSTINALAIDPKNTNVIYAATNDGVYKSSDGGAIWTQLNLATFFSLRVSSIAVDPVNTSTIYAGANTFIYKSVDSGQTWQSKTINTPTGSVIDIFSIAIDPVTPATIYLGTFRGVFKSTDGGDTWTAANTGLSLFPGSSNIPRVNRLVMDPTNPQTLYAATNFGIFKTVNGGTNWAVSGNGLPGSASDIRALVIDPASPNTLYAGLSFSGVYKTTDGGANWNARSTGLPPATILTMAIDPASPSTVYATAFQGGVFKTTDGAANWGAANSGLNNLTINALAVDPANSANVYAGAAIGADAFAAKINPAGSALAWITYLGGAEADAGRAIAVDKDGNAYVAGSSNSIDFSAANTLPSPNTAGADAFIAKINAAGTAFVYSSRFGGVGTESVGGVAVTSSGQAVIAGTTNSTNFPVASPMQPSIGGANDAFVVRVNAAGSAFDFSTWLGGTFNDSANSVALDGAGAVYVAGLTNSTNFPTQDAPQNQFSGGSGNDAFVTKINAAGSALIYSTYLGGQGADSASGIAVDSVGNAYVTGTTSSQNFPVASPLQPALRGFSSDAFVTKLGVETDLAITKTASRNPVMVNNNFSYTLVATNRGPSAATGVVVTDQLPAGINFVSATSSVGACSNNSGAVTCNIGALSAQASATITIVATPAAAGTINNTANVSGAEPDGNTANNQANAQITASAQPSIYGRVTLANNDALAGVTMSLGGASSSTQQTNGNGFYQFANLQTGANYTVTPSRNGYSFEPPSRGANNLNSDQSADFTATPCSYSIAPVNQSFGASGGNGSVTVTATPRCPWTAATADNWITINSGASGSGNGSVNFTVAATTAPRVGRIVVAGQTFAVYQGFNPCNLPRFGSKSYYLGSNPSLIQSADFNGDGISDLAVLQTSHVFFPNNPNVFFGLTVLLSDASGKLTALPTIGVPTTSISMVVGDFNGDAKPDIFVAHDFPVAIRIFVNNGSGGFNAPIEATGFTSSNSLSAIYAAEVNRDNKTDLIGVINDSVLVIINNGGGFNAPINVSFGGYSPLGVADVNGDGVTDVMAYRGSIGAFDLRVFLGDGFGSFSLPISSPISGTPRYMAAGDFNGDGKTDLTITNLVANGGSNSNNVSVLLGDGAGGFGSQTGFTLEDQDGPITAADFNNDAKLDVAVSTSGKLFTLTGDGTGKLGAGSVSPNGEQPGKLLVGRFNSDARVDLATTTARNGLVSVYLNRCGSVNGTIISGRVTDRYPNYGFAGVTVKLSGAKTETIQTDGGGNYEFTGLTPGSSYTVTPERPSVEFNPANLSFQNLTTDQVADFTGTRKLVAVSAASYAGLVVAPDSIVALFGADLSLGTAVATSLPLPYSLSGAGVSIGPSTGGSGSPAPLFFVSPGQFNILIPPDVPVGEAKIGTYSGGSPSSPSSEGFIRIENVAPGLFTANASGQGVAAAVVLRVKADGAQVYEPVARFDQAQGRFVSVPIDVSDPNEQVFLLLFGTGFRKNSGIANVNVKIGGENVEALFAGAQGDLAGLDQLNLRVPRSLMGRGEIDVVFTVDGKTANTVRVNIK